jgi:hypothetical protein
MLRMRPKPPVGIENINNGQPWSELDLADLRDELRRGVPIRDIAEYLRRDVAEVDAKATELRLLP